MQYLPDETIRAIMPTTEQIVSMARSVIRGLRDGSVTMAPRPTIEARSGVRFMAFPVILEDERIAGVKWLGITPAPTSAGRVGSIIALSRIDGAQPYAILDGRWITAIRTAAVSLVAALAMARPDSRRIAFLACGEQAELHLELFARHFALEEVSTHSRTMQTAERFATHARAEIGCRARAFASIRECVDGADIVITSTPGATEVKLRAEWLKPSCFCSLVDLGRSFVPATLEPDALFAADDIKQFLALSQGGQIAPFATVRPVALADLLDRDEGAARHGGFLMPTGLGAIDIRIADAVVQLAAAQAGARNDRGMADPS